VNSHLEKCVATFFSVVVVHLTSCLYFLVQEKNSDLMIIHYLVKNSPLFETQYITWIYRFWPRSKQYFCIEIAIPYSMHILWGNKTCEQWSHKKCTKQKKQ